MKKITGTIILLAMLMTSLGGCSGSASRSDIVYGDMDNTAQLRSNGLTAELKIMGNKVALPFRFGELKNLRVDPNTVYNCTDTSVYGMLYYGDCRIGRVVLENCQSDETDLSEKEVSLISICPDKEFEEFDFSYLGFSMNTTRDQITECLGTPDEINGNYILYNLDDKGHYVRFAFSTNYLKIKKITICVADTMADSSSGINRFYENLD